MKSLISMFKVGSIAIAIMSGNVLFAEDATVLNPKTSAEWTWGWNTKAVNAVESENALSCQGATDMISKEGIKIEPGKSYKISGSFKLAPDSKPSKFYLSLMPLDSKGQPISSESVGVIAGTETELAADCNPDDLVIKIKNGEKWKTDSYGRIAFNVDDTGKKADLPNNELSGTGITKVEKKDDVFELTLKNKCGKKYPAGTKIREHKSGATYIYIGAMNKDVPAEWTEVSGVFKKENLWLASSGAKIVVRANFGGKPDQTMLLKDVKIEEVK